MCAAAAAAIDKGATETAITHRRISVVSLAIIQRSPCDYWLMTVFILRKLLCTKAIVLFGQHPKLHMTPGLTSSGGENLALRKLLLLLLKTCCWTRCRSIGGWCVPKNLSRKITTKKALQFTNKSIEILYLIETYKQPRRFQWIFLFPFFLFPFLFRARFDSSTYLRSRAQEKRLDMAKAKK